MKRQFFRINSYPADKNLPSRSYDIDTVKYAVGALIFMVLVFIGWVTV